MSTTRISTMLISSLLLLATPACSQSNLSPGCYCRQGLVSGQVAGIIVGVIVFLVIAILLFGYFHTRRKERRSREVLPTSNNMPPLMAVSDSGYTEGENSGYTALRKGSLPEYSDKGMSSNVPKIPQPTHAVNQPRLTGRT